MRKTTVEWKRNGFVEKIGLIADFLAAPAAKSVHMTNIFAT